MKYAAININFDSLAEAYGFPEQFDDPTFDRVAERFMAIADKYGFKYSIYVIGKDLETEKNKRAVRQWSKTGHEIGNHSWSHPLSLGALPEDQIKDQIGKAHEIIAETVGEAPKGFIAPGWSTSGRVVKTLLGLGYEYDTSVFPSLLLYPSLAKMLLNQFGSDRFRSVLRRRDLHLPIFGRRNAHILSAGKRSMVSLPLPTNKWRIACWHTTAFVFGEARHLKLLRQCLETLDSFYYLVHPADLVGAEDLDPDRKSHMERMDQSLDYKIELLEKMIEAIIESGRQIVTMRELAEKFRAKKSPAH